MLKKQQGAAKTVNLALRIHIDKIQALSAPENCWVRALIKRGDHKHLTQGISQNESIPKGDAYSQP